VVSGCGQDIGDDLGLEHSVVSESVCQWPVLTPFSSRGGGEAQFRDQDNCVVLMAPNSWLVWYGLVNKISLCGLGWVQTCYIDQISLELTKFHLPLPPKCWNEKYVSAYLAP
jgi:hypothetical protein